MILDIAGFFLGAIAKAPWSSFSDKWSLYSWSFYFQAPGNLTDACLQMDT